MGKQCVGVPESRWDYPMASGDLIKDLVVKDNIDEHDVVCMSPEAFLKFTVVPKSEPQVEIVEEIEEEIKGGKLLDPVWMRLKGSNVSPRVSAIEGRHRAKAAQNLGISRIPVLVIDLTSFGGVEYR